MPPQRHDVRNVLHMMSTSGYMSSLKMVEQVEPTLLTGAVKAPCNPHPNSRNASYARE